METISPMVDRLKLELKRALRKQMTEAVNDVCGAFEEELKQPPVAPKVGASAFESDYDCCRRLVEYIVRNMDTSSNFAQQMDCVILAYQSGASTEILNSVVTQDLWFKRRECSSLLFRSREDGGEEMQGGGEEDSVVVITGQIAASSEEALEIKLEKLRGVASDAGEGTRSEKTQPVPLKVQDGDDKTRSQRAQYGVAKSPVGGSLDDRIKSHLSTARQWGKRKRLSTKKHARPTAQAPKRSRQEPSRSIQATDQIIGEEGSSKDDIFQQASNNDESIDEIPAKKMDKVQDANTKSLAKALETLKERMTMGTKGGDRKIAEADTGDAKARAGTRPQLVVRDQVSDDTIIEAQYRQMQRELEGGDTSFSLSVAKTRFQSMVNEVVKLLPEDPPSMATQNHVETQDNHVSDPIDKLCDVSRRSLEHTRFFKSRLRDTILIVDALLCDPPPGCICTQGCEQIRAQMCNKFEPCINPTCRTWHDAETHTENCQNELCEFKIRVMLRETLHLIGHKELEVSGAREALAKARFDLDFATKSADGDTTSLQADIIRLEKDLQDKNGELIVLHDTEAEHWESLYSIDINDYTDKTDGFPDFDLHYASKKQKQ